MNALINIILLITGLCTFLYSCQKNTNGEGYLTITIKYNGTALSNAAVYIKKGTLSNPGIPVDQYDFKAITASDGRVTLNGLKPDNYFLHGKVYIASENRYAEGNDSVTVRQRFRQNTYDVVINTQ